MTLPYSGEARAGDPTRCGEIRGSDSKWWDGPCCRPSSAESAWH